MANALERSAGAPLGVGVVGCGLIGRRRAQFAQASPASVVRLVADIDETPAAALAAEVDAASTTDWQEVVTRDDIDIVVVATPNKYLMPVVVAALEQGKHVLCEKPPGRSAGEAGEMAAVAHRTGRVLKIGFNHRYHPGILKAHELCSAGAVGKPMYVRAVYGHGGRPGYDQEWRGSADLAGGGELLDQGVHIVDLCRWFLGEFATVYGVTNTYFWNLGHFPSGHQLEDNAFAILQTDQGQVAQLHTSWTQWKNRFSFELFGEDGYLRLEGLGGSYGPETLTFGRRRPESGPPNLETFEFTGPDDSWAAEWDDLITAIRTGRRPWSDGADGLQTMRVIAALYEAAQSGKVVHL